MERDLPDSMIALRAGDDERVERMLQVFAYLRLKYESQILDKYVYSEDQSRRFNKDDPWTEYLEDLLRCSMHKETLGAFNNTQPTEQFVTEWMKDPQTLQSLRQEARETVSPSSIGWMFETHQTIVREMCERTKLDFAPWLTNIFHDSEYPKILQENETKLRDIAEALMHHQSKEAERMTPSNIYINWNLTEKDRLNVNSA